MRNVFRQCPVVAPHSHEGTQWNYEGDLGEVIKLSGQLKVLTDRLALEKGDILSWADARWCDWFLARRRPPKQPIRIVSRSGGMAYVVQERMNALTEEEASLLPEEAIETTTFTFNLEGWSQASIDWLGGQLAAVLERGVRVGKISPEQGARAISGKVTRRFRPGFLSRLEPDREKLSQLLSLLTRYIK